MHRFAFMFLCLFVAVAVPPPPLPPQSVSVAASDLPHVTASGVPILVAGNGLWTGAPFGNRVKKMDSKS